MREIARPEVKRRRRFKRAVVAPAAAVPEPSVADKYYAQKKTCRMVELGIKVPGCKGTFIPRGNEAACSPACRAKLHSYSAKKNRPKHRAAINARDRANAARKRGPLLGRPCQGPDCLETYYSWNAAQKFCSKRCHMNHENEVRKKRYHAAALERATARPTRQCQTCGKAIPKWRNGKVFKATRFCSLKCSRKARDRKYRAAKARTQAAYRAANREKINAKAREAWHAKKRQKTALA
jgi:predicted nucleic acid-binding Zn ribbon protein